MKFGLYSSIANPPRGRELARCIDEVIAEAQLAEASGFDSCFFGEHHQDKDGFLPSPLIVATAVAAHTRRLRVGTSVILLPLHHPVRVAEDVITLDLDSKGRVIIGVGVGYQPADFRAFNVPMEDRAARFEEGVEILRRCWSGEPFSFKGKHYTLEDVQIRPRPIQPGGPPLWIGASVPAAARRAGRIADGFVGTPSTSLESATPTRAARRTTRSWRRSGSSAIASCPTAADHRSYFLCAASTSAISEPSTTVLTSTWRGSTFSSNRNFARSARLACSGLSFAAE